MPISTGLSICDVGVNGVNNLLDVGRVRLPWRSDLIGADPDSNWSYSVVEERGRIARLNLGQKLSLVSPTAVSPDPHELSESLALFNRNIDVSWSGSLTLDIR